MKGAWQREESAYGRESAKTEAPVSEGLLTATRGEIVSAFPLRRGSFSRASCERSVDVGYGNIAEFGGADDLFDASRSDDVELVADIKPSAVVVYPRCLNHSPVHDALGRREGQIPEANDIAGAELVLHLEPPTRGTLT